MAQIEHVLNEGLHEAQLARDDDTEAVEQSEIVLRKLLPSFGENSEDLLHQVDHELERDAHLVVHGRFVRFCLLRLIVLLLFLQSVKLAVDFPRDVIEDDGDGLLAEVDLGLDLDRDELQIFLLFLQIATVAHER